MDTNYGWLRLHCAPELVADAAVAMANGLAAVASSTQANVTEAGRSDFLSIGPVQVSASGPFVALDDVGDFPRLRVMTRALAEYLEADGIEGVLTVLDHREGTP